MTDDLFSTIRVPETIGTGAWFLPGEAAPDRVGLLCGIATVLDRAPLRRLLTPGGRAFSVRMTNCGIFGWHSDEAGYRYVRQDPVTGLDWPPIPQDWYDLAVRAAARAGYDGFRPEACLVNCYEPGARMGLHQDCDEKALSSPIVSVSLGVPAQFLFGGKDRTASVRRIRLEDGDVVVWGGASRLAFHGIAPLASSLHDATGPLRWNLTFRRVGLEVSP